MRRSGCSRITECDIASESAPEPIGRITLDAKRPGKRRTGNPFAPFDEAGTGDGLMANLHGHEAGNGGHSQGEPPGTAPVLDPTAQAVPTDGGPGAGEADARRAACPRVHVLGAVCGHAVLPARPRPLLAGDLQGGR